MLVSGQVSEHWGMLAVTERPVPDRAPDVRCYPHMGDSRVRPEVGIPHPHSCTFLKAESVLVAHDKLNISNLHEIITTLKILILSENNHACGFGIILCDLNKLNIYRAGSFISNSLQAKKRVNILFVCPLCWAHSKGHVSSNERPLPSSYF